MNIFFFVLALILATILSNIIDSKINIIPRAIIQIIIGLILSLVPNFNHFVLEPEIFMLVIIAPLMFYDGMNTNITKLKMTLGNTFSLAVGLALTTILLIGYLGYYLLPGIPLALAFVLASIITPTDAVAVSSVTKNLDIPSSAMTSLKNESLFNDASGLVLFDLALSAFTTGNFSPMMSIFKFLYVFFGGLIIGWIGGWLFIRLHTLILSANIDDANIVVPINLIKPFAIYLIAELLGTSGILAVVVAGLIQSAQIHSLRLTSTKTQLVSQTTYEISTDLMNGFVFILLGVTLPTVVYDITNNGRVVTSLTYLIMIGIALYLTMILIRYLWVTFRLASIKINSKAQRFNHFLIALNGIHGTITLAMAFSIPLSFKGDSFPFRNDFLFIASTVIVLSLMVPSLLLPWLLPKKHQTYKEEDIDNYRRKMIEYATKQVRELEADPIETQAVIVTLQSQQFIEKRPKRKFTFRILQKCFDLEEILLQKLVDQGKITRKQQILYERMTLFQSSQLHQPLIYHIIYRFKHLFFRFIHRFRRNRPKIDPSKIRKKFTIARDDMAEIEDLIAPYIFDYLNKHHSMENQSEIRWIEGYYRERHRRFQNNARTNEIQEELFIHAFQSEYNFVQNQLANNHISRELANSLYEQIANDEWIYMQNDRIYT